MTIISREDLARLRKQTAMERVAESRPEVFSKDELFQLYFGSFVLMEEIMERYNMTAGDKFSIDMHTGDIEILV